VPPALVGNGDCAWARQYRQRETGETGFAAAGQATNRTAELQRWMSETVRMAYSIMPFLALSVVP
jgi:hypothetical protein